MEFEFKAIVVIGLEHKKNWTKSNHVHTSIVLETSPNLSCDSYHDEDGNPTELGVNALTQTLVQGLISNIHYAHQKGLIKDHVHLENIIKELGRGFATNAIVSEGTINTEKKPK